MRKERLDNVQWICSVSDNSILPLLFNIYLKLQGEVTLWFRIRYHPTILHAPGLGDDTKVFSQCSKSLQSKMELLLFHQFSVCPSVVSWEGGSWEISKSWASCYYLNGRWSLWPGGQLPSFGWCTSSRAQGSCYNHYLTRLMQWALREVPFVDNLKTMHWWCYLVG